MPPRFKNLYIKTKTGGLQRVHALAYWLNYKDPALKELYMYRSLVPKNKKAPVSDISSVVHELIHLVLKQKNREIWRFIDEGLACFWGSIIAPNFNRWRSFRENSDLEAGLELMTLAGGEIKGFWGPIIKEPLPKLIPQSDGYWQYLWKMSKTQKCSLGPKILSKSLPCFKPDDSLMKIMVDYILSLATIAILVIRYNCRFKQLSKINSYQDFYRLLARIELPRIKLEKELFGLFCQGLGLGQEELAQIIAREAQKHLV